MTLVDFSDFGLHDPVPVDQEELQAIWWGAKTMLNQNTAAELRDITERWELCLNYSALKHEPLEDEWFGRALLCMAIMGLLGDRAPRFIDVANWH